MIRVTQGHQNSISLEVFLKSFLCLNKDKQNNITLYCGKESLEQNLEFLRLKYSIKDNAVEFSGNTLKCFFIDKNPSETTGALLSAMEDIKDDDVLFTLPSSKDQFFINETSVSGHTEFFRKYFKQEKICMYFNRNDLNILLLTDHIPLEKVGETLTTDFIYNKVLFFLKNMNFSKVIFTGINPHSGEDGLLGVNENLLKAAFEQLRRDFPKTEFLGPYAGDTAIFKHKSKDQLFIYAFHDQGLGVFKTIHKLNGKNITIGLPFRRVSVDHGTSFELYGKNIANYTGCLEILEEYA